MTSPSNLRASLKSLEGMLPVPDAALAAGAVALFDAREAALEKLRSLAKEVANPESELAKRSRDPSSPMSSGTKDSFASSVTWLRLGRCTR